MQLIEAMACGTTCFSSGRGALEEVSGGFALPLNINDPKAAGRQSPMHRAAMKIPETTRYKKSTHASLIGLPSDNW